MVVAGPYFVEVLLMTDSEDKIFIEFNYYLISNKLGMIVRMISPFTPICSNFTFNCF